MIEDTRVGRAWRRVVGPGGDLFEAGAISESSWLTYHYGLSNLERYCARRNLVALPAEPETLKAWIKWMMDEEPQGESHPDLPCRGVHRPRRGLVAALKRLADLKRERARLLHRRRPSDEGTGGTDQ